MSFDCIYAKQDTKREVQNQPSGSATRGYREKSTSLNQRRVMLSDTNSQQSWSTYKQNLKERRERTRQMNKGLIRQEVNGYTRLGKQTYLD